MISEGKFKAVAKSWDFGTRDNGSEYVQVVFQLMNGPNSEQLITWWGSFKSAKSTTIAIEALRAAGMKNNDLENPEGIGDVACYVTIRHEEYNGKLSPRVAFVNSSAGVPVKNKLDAGSLKKLSAKAARILEQVPVVTGAEPAPETPEPPTPVAAEASGGFDELPF